MTLDYSTMTLEQLNNLECAAYAAGDTDSAALFGALIEVTTELIEANDELTLLKDETADHEEYKSFFENCFTFLDGPYASPSVTSGRDQCVIFDAIEAGEAARRDH